MPVGGIKRAAQDIQARREAGQKSFGRFFRIKDGETHIVRFLEEGEGIHWCWTHKMPAIGKQQWGDDVPCLDQDGDGTPCPGCEQGVNKKFKGYINVIQRDAPKFDTDSDGRVDWEKQVGEEDAVCTWEQGITVFEELDGLDADYKGLTSRDFKITRKGSGLNTKYSIRPAKPDAGAEQMGSQDQKLAGEKPDLREKISPPTYDEMQKRLSGGVVGGQGVGSQQSSQGDINPFLTDDSGQAVEEV